MVLRETKEVNKELLFFKSVMISLEPRQLNLSQFISTQKNPQTSFVNIFSRSKKPNCNHRI